MSSSYPFILHASAGTMTRHFVVTNEAEEARAHLALLNDFRRYYPTPRNILSQKADSQAGLHLDPSAALYLDNEDGLQELPEQLQSVIRETLSIYKSVVARRQKELDEVLTFAKGVEYVLSLPAKDAIALQHESGVPLVEYLVMWRSNHEYERVWSTAAGPLS